MTLAAIWLPAAMNAYRSPRVTDPKGARHIARGIAAPAVDALRMRPCSAIQAIMTHKCVLAGRLDRDYLSLPAVDSGDEDLIIAS